MSWLLSITLTSDSMPISPSHSWKNSMMVCDRSSSVAREQPEGADRAAVGHGAQPVGADLVARLVQQLAGLVEVERERLVLGRLPPEGLVGRGDERVARDRGPLVGALDQPVDVQRVAEGVPERRVLQRRVAVAERLAALGVDRAGVEGDLLEVRRDAVLGVDAVAALQRLDLDRA